jgi:tripartite-type tricarboxylate transporter receptor subunit TctC
VKAKPLLSGALIVVLVFALALSGCGGAKEVKQAQPNYPAKPVSLVVQFASGGSSDLLGRAMASTVSKHLGQPVVVENKPGASGTIGTDYVLKSKPDGYTLLTTSTGNFTSTPLVQSVPYDPNKDVRHIINIATHPILFVVNSESQWKTIDEFVAYVKQNPGKVKYGQNAPGGATHMAVEMFRKAAGLDMKMVPYAGGTAEVLTAILGKHVEAGIMHPQEAGEYIKQGTVRVLFSFSEKRLKSMPDVPTAKEKGYNVVLGVTKGIAGPAALPEAVVKKIHDAFQKMMEDDAFKAAATGTGDIDYLDYMTGEDTAKLLQKQYKDMEPLIKELGLAKDQKK